MEMLVSLYGGRYASLKDRAKERKWLETAIEHEDVKDITIMKLAGIYEEDANILPEEIVALYMKAAGKGNTDAFLKLGEAYRYGAGVDAAPARRCGITGSRLVMARHWLWRLSNRLMNAA